MWKIRRRRIYGRRTVKQRCETTSPTRRGTLLDDSMEQAEKGIQKRFSSVRPEDYARNGHSYVSVSSILLAADGYGGLRRPWQQENRN